ncbi:MAG: translocation/assembly module TamB domain-containing protein, partial [Deltaproteobacteria bacterium]|nr:translocation/assembly module TamB domain-containing protein [Deltaproteobacteria bacterium]
ILQGSVSKNGRIKVSVNAAGNWGKLYVRGRAGLQPDSEIDLKTEWTLNDLPISHPAQGAGSLKGTLGNILVEQEIRAPLRAKVQGVIENVTSSPRWRAEVTWEKTNLRDIKADLRDVYFKGRLKGSGDIAHATCEVKSEITDTQFGVWRARIRASGGKHRWEVSSAEFIPVKQGGKITGQAVINLGENGEPDIDLKAEWKDLHLNLLSQDLDGYLSPEGTLTFRGSLKEYNLSLEPVLQVKDMPVSKWSLKAWGDEKALQRFTLSGDWLEGNWSSEGELTFSPDVSWTAAIKAEGVNPGLWRAEWAGSLATELHTTGSREKDKLNASVDVRRLDGTLRGFPVKASGFFRMNEGRYEVADLDVRSGSARLNGSGSYQDEWDVAWSLTAKRMEELFPDIKGAVSAHGRITGPLKKPRIRADAKVKNLSRENMRLQFMEARINGGLEEDQPIKVSIKAVNIQVDKQSIRNVLITADGVAQGHDLTVDIKKNDREYMRIEGRGGFSNNQWKVSINDGALAEKQVGKWVLEKPAHLSLSMEKINLDQLCVEQDESQAQGCVSLAWQKEGAIEVSLDLNRFDLRTLGPLMTYGQTTVTGTVDGQGFFSVKGGKLVNAGADFQAREGAFVYPLVDEQVNRTPYRILLLSLENTSKGFLGKLNFDLAEFGQAQGSLLIPGWRPGSPLAASQPISGRMELSVSDLGLVEKIIPDVDSVKGSISSSLSISGTRAAPRVSGRIQLTDGAFIIPRLGVKVSEIQVEANNKDHETMSITGTAHSAPGSLEFSGQIHYPGLDSISATFFIKGVEFGVADLPELKLAVSPDLNVEIKPHRVYVRGTVVIPEAEIQPVKFEQAARSSSDVVIVGAKEESSSNSAWEIHNEIKIELGDNIQVKAYGLTGKVAGGLMIREDKNGVLTGQGELHITEGSYTVYGQKLVIDQGRVIFLGGPLENPGVNFRAKREIKDVVAGVLVSGNLKNPEVNLFSNPSMDDANILSYLILGRPINLASGEQSQQLQQAALGVGLAGGGMLAGKLTEQFGIEEIGFETGETLEDTAMILGAYLTPNIYVRYVDSLWSSVYNLTIRYQLGKNWAIEALAGNQSGADIILSTER